MIEKEKRTNNNKLYLLIIGLTLILFSSLILFTRPALWDFFDFSKTGQIGDTIGGITAPIINIVGAVLIYISFKAQINANKIQFKLLYEEIQNQQKDRNFQVTLELFESLKNDYQNVKYENFNGQPALNSYSNEIQSYWDEKRFIYHTKIPVYSDWKFLLAQYDLITHHIESSQFRLREKSRLATLVRNYYFTHLEYPTNRIKAQIDKHKIETDVAKIINDNINFNNNKAKDKNGG